MGNVAPVGLRERKKVQRYRALAAAARELTIERGLEAVSVEDIAAAADVSVRTFHNYFSCKEEAIIGVEPSGVAALAEGLVARPADESPFEALAALIAPDTERLPEAAHQWLLRTELVRRYPSLLPLHLAGLARLEEALTVALATRLGVDADKDPYPAVAVSAVMGVVRSTMRWWRDRESDLALAEVLQQNLATLRSGLERPEGVR
jgi:AcrR family transcriptional regulator